MATVPGQGPYDDYPNHDPPPVGPDLGVWIQCADGKWRAFYAANVGPAPLRQWSIPHPDDPNWFALQGGSCPDEWACRHGAVWNERLDSYRPDGPCSSRGDGSCGPRPNAGISDEEFEEYRERVLQECLKRSVHYSGIVKQTNPSTLHMDGTSPVVVAVQATTDDLRELKGKRVRLVVEDA